VEHFGNIPPFWVLPNIKHEVNLIISLNIHRYEGKEFGVEGFAYPKVVGSVQGQGMSQNKGLLQAEGPLFWEPPSP